MSTSGRYQSRLFSFLSQQSLRLKDKTSQAWRQVKLTAVWGTQIALYPIYALFQTGRLLGKQMGQAARQTVPRLRAVKQQILPSQISSSELGFLEPFGLASDTPIHNLLVKNRAESSTSLIQGFASLLISRGLVLVTAENEILDVLTEEQQIQLQRQMIWEMASYWRHRKTQYKIQPSPEDQPQLQGWTHTFLPLPFLPLPKERTHVLPPIRAFRRLMTWIQLSSVAIAVNLFQESRLVALPSAPNISLDISPDISPTNINLRDLPLRSAQPPRSWVNQLVRDLVTDRSTVTDRAPKPLPLLTWVKCQAAGLAEFSKSLAGLLQNSSIVLYDPLPKSEPEGLSFVPSPLPRKPWLKIEDFFGGKFLGMTGSGQMVKRGEEGLQSNGEKEAIAVEYFGEITPFDPANANDLTTRSPSTSAIDQFAKNEEAIVSTLLEAEVTESSYETHPLEQLLKWLDQGMLWIEQKLEQLWNWIKRS